MAITTEKKKAVSLKEILAAAKKLSAKEKQLLKKKLLGNGIVVKIKK